MIGPHGYCADVSRTFLCGESRPSGEQRRLYGLAWEQIHVNMQLLQPGLGFRELAERSWRSEEHTSELQSLMRNSYAVFCLKKKTHKTTTNTHNQKTPRPNTTHNNAI